MEQRLAWLSARFITGWLRTVKTYLTASHLISLEYANGDLSGIPLYRTSPDMDYVRGSTLVKKDGIYIEIQIRTLITAETAGTPLSCHIDMVGVGAAPSSLCSSPCSPPSYSYVYTVKSSIIQVCRLIRRSSPTQIDSQHAA